MKPRILLLEPSSRFRRVLKAALEQGEQAVVVAEAADSMQALSLAERIRPTAMVVSLEPGEDVSGLCRGIMRSRPMAIILLCAEAGDPGPAVERALAEGAVGFLVKPKSLDDVQTNREWRRLVREILGLAEVKLVRTRASGSAPAVPPPPVAVPNAPLHGDKYLAGTPTWDTMGVDALAHEAAQLQQGLRTIA